MQAGSGREEQWEGNKASKVTKQTEQKHMAMPPRNPLHHIGETPALFYLVHY